jgi:hypothetical protein
MIPFPINKSKRKIENSIKKSKVKIEKSIAKQKYA